VTSQTSRNGAERRGGLFSIFFSSILAYNFFSSDAKTVICSFLACSGFSLSPKEMNLNDHFVVGSACDVFAYVLAFRQNYKFAGLGYVALRLSANISFMGLFTGVS